MTTMKEQLAADLDLFFDLDVFAESVTYNNGTLPAEIKAVVDYGGAFEKQAKVARVTVKKIDVPDPGYRHTFAIDGETWTIKSDKNGLDVSGDQLVWEIGLVKDERSDAWRI